MDAIRGQEINLPVLQPATLWQESGRYESLDESLVRLKDRTGQEMVLAMTHEEAVTDLVRSMVDSYRQLPLMVYQIQNKVRDEPRARGGLVRLREFIMKDAYSFHRSTEDLDAYYFEMVQAYRNVYRRCGVEALVVESDTGMMGGREAHEFMLLSDGGEDTLMTCPACGYAANREVAISDKGEAPNREAVMKPIEEMYTPNTATIAELAAVASISPRETMKCVFYTSGDELILAVIRGDLEVNDVKLQNLTRRSSLRSLSPEEATNLGLTVGYASPVGLALSMPTVIVADDSVLEARNLGTGANREGYHIAGVNYGRDFTAHYTGDIAAAAEGQACAACGGTIRASRGIEAGNTFKLGTKYSETMACNYTDSDGSVKSMIMGCYGIGITRLLACIIEQNHDERGIIWPVTVAPYLVHLLVAGKEPEAQQTAERLYASLGATKVLYDDRDLGAGAKFTDADLMGMPVRITVSPRSLAAGGVELQVRRTGSVQVVAPENVPAVLQTITQELIASETSE